MAAATFAKSGVPDGESADAAARSGFDVTEVAVPWWPLTRAQHGNHSSARWPGDAYLFARRRITTLG